MIIKIKNAEIINHLTHENPAMFKVNNRNTRTMCETLEQCVKYVQS